jgi:hypothetical protein
MEKAFLHLSIPVQLKERVADLARANRRSVVRQVQVILDCPSEGSATL